MKKERNSSIEMLRILAMLGIVIMHTNGAVMEHGSGTGFAWTEGLMGSDPIKKV